MKLLPLSVACLLSGLSTVFGGAGLVTGTLSGTGGGTSTLITSGDLSITVTPSTNAGVITYNLSTVGGAATNVIWPTAGTNITLVTNLDNTIKVSVDGSVLTVDSEPTLVNDWIFGNVYADNVWTELHGDGNDVTNLNAEVNGLSTTNWVQTNAQMVVRVEAFGAVRNGAIANGCAMAYGTNKLTCASGTFAVGDVGKVISVYMAGGTNLNLTSTITNRLSATAVLLTDIAWTNVAGMPSVYGTDDTAAIQAGINHVTTNGGGTLTFTNGIYIVNGPLVDVGTTNDHHNSQLTIPNMTMTGQHGPTIRLEGLVTPQSVQNSGSPYELSAAGAILWSTLASGPDVNPGSVLDCRNTVNPIYIVGPDRKIPYNAIRVDVDKMTWRGCYDANLAILNLEAAYGASVTACQIDAGFGAAAGPFANLAAPIRTNGYGLKLPGFFNDNSAFARQVSVARIYNGIYFADNAYIEAVPIFRCINAYRSDNGSAGMAFIRGNTIQDCRTIFYMRGQSYPIKLEAVIGIHNTEEFVAGACLFDDPDSDAVGNITYSISPGQTMTNGPGAGEHMGFNFNDPTDAWRSHITASTLKATSVMRVDRTDDSYALQYFSTKAGGPVWWWGKYPDASRGDMALHLNGFDDVLSANTNGNVAVTYGLSGGYAGFPAAVKFNYGFTAASGVVTGNITAGTFTGNAEGLTNLSDAALSTNVVTRTNLMVIIGDSLSELNSGSWTNSRTNWTAQMAGFSDVWDRSSISNLALGGRTTTDGLTDSVTSRQLGATNNYRPGYCFVWLGVNDPQFIINNTITTNTVYQNLTNIWFTNRQAGFKVVAFTLAPVSTWSANTNATLWTNINNMILSDRSKYDFLVRPDKVFTMADASGDKYLDGIHLSAKGSLLLAAEVGRVLHGNTGNKIGADQFPASFSVVRTNRAGAEIVNPIILVTNWEDATTPLVKVSGDGNSNAKLTISGAAGSKMEYATSFIDILGPITIRGSNSRFEDLAGVILMRWFNTNCYVYTNFSLVNGANLGVSGTVTATNGIILPSGAVSNYVWTCTNASGAGNWAAGGAGGGDAYLGNAQTFTESNRFTFGAFIQTLQSPEIAVDYLTVTTNLISLGSNSFNTVYIGTLNSGTQTVDTLVVNSNITFPLVTTTQIAMPTNLLNCAAASVIDMGKAYRWGSVTGNFNLAGFSNTSTNVLSAVWFMTNSIGSNCVFAATNIPYLLTGDGLRTWIVTNGQGAVFSVNTYGEQMTNAVFRNLW